MKATIYKEAKRLGIPTDSHESDLYLKVTTESIELVHKYNKQESATKFISQIDKAQWYDIPFAYDPFWEKRQHCDPQVSQYGTQSK